MSDLTIEVHQREQKGKNANRRLRAEGKVPAVVYGAHRDPMAIELDRRTLIELMRKTRDQNPVFLLKLQGTDKSRHAMIRDVHLDPVSREVLHVDFQRVLMTEKVRVSVHIELHGTPVGVKNEGAMLDFVTREVEVECLPDRIPAKLEIDVSELHAGQHVEASALTIPEGVELLEEPQRVIASVSHVRVAAEEEAEEEEALLTEAAADEPELIRRHKDEDEDEEG